MTKHTHFMLIVLTIMCTFLIILGCSKDNPQTDLSKIKKKGEISFAMSGGYPPFNYFNNKNELVGFDVDVAREIAHRLGVKLKPITTDWSGIIEGLRSGAYDGILGSMAATEKRKKVVDFSIPYYYSGAQLLVRKDTPFAQSQDLAGKSIGVVTGTTYQQDAQKLQAKDVKLYKNDTQTLTELNNGVVDAVITDRVVGVNAINSGKFSLRLLGAPLRSEDIAVAFRKGDNALEKKINSLLTKMHNDGTLSRLSQKWLKTDITVK